MSTQHRDFSRRNFLKTGTLLGASALGGFAPFETSLTNAFAAPNPEAESAAAPKFVKAVPVWALGLEKEMNVTLAFGAKFDVADAETAKNIILRSTGSTIMKITVNGEFAGYGPARGPHGWFRVDEWKIGALLKPGQNSVVIKVAGYNANSYYHLDQPSFLQAEIVDGDGNVLAATADQKKSDATAFQASYSHARLQKVQRFSFQRPFIEVYDLGRFLHDGVGLAEQPAVKYLPRRVPQPEFAIIEPKAWGATGKATRREKLENPWRDRSLVNVGPKLKGYKLDELEIVLSDEIQRLETKFDANAKPLALDSVYKAGDVQVVDFGANYCGFFGFELEAASEGAKIALTFDELATENGDVNFLRLGTCSAFQWTIPADGAPLQTISFSGKPLRLEAFEPHCGRYAKIHCLEGSFKLKKFYLREYAHPAIREAAFACADKRLEEIYRAAILTYRENALDVFMDCPHRERAGWLCDSFFTARTAFDLTGKTDVEQAFLENYQLPEKFAFLPDGMLPMCYPADHNDGIYIPNWSLWFVAELEEYALRSPDRSTINGLRRRVEKLFKFFEKFENSDGLLEKLDSWVFVEWSAANNFVQDVNYPSNMLYAAALDAAGRIYGVDAWREKAAKIRAKIVEQSFDGEFFVDHAVRKEDGSLEILRDRTEVCQYFAFFFKTATPESHPKLWATLLDKFGPNRVKEGGYPEIHKANSFVGNVVRLELLATANRADQLLEESVAYNLYMAERTGTLWENDSPHASCDHGFASHVVRIFHRDVAGIHAVDAVAKKIAIRLPKLDRLDWASATQPVPGGSIKIRWEKQDGKLAYTLETPAGYDVAIENASGLEAVRR